jgi:hypothetical protein
MTQTLYAHINKIKIKKMKMKITRFHFILSRMVINKETL